MKFLGWFSLIVVILRLGIETMAVFREEEAVLSLGTILLYVPVLVYIWYTM